MTAYEHRGGDQAPEVPPQHGLEADDAWQGIIGAYLSKRCDMGSIEIYEVLRDWRIRRDYASEIHAIGAGDHVMSPAASRQDAQPLGHGHQAEDAAQARARYLQMAGGGLVAALLGTATRPAEIRIRDGKPWLVFAAVPDGARSSAEVPASIRVEYLGPDVEALAVRFTKGTQVYAEGRLTLNAWTGKDGAERCGLNITATHVEVLGRGLTLP